MRNLKAKKANVYRENIKIYKNRISEILSTASHHHIEEKVIKKNPEDVEKEDKTRAVYLGRDEAKC